MRLHAKNTSTLAGYSQTPGEFARKVTGLTISVEIGDYSGDEVLCENDDLTDLYDNVIFADGIDKEACLEWIFQLMKADAEELGYSITKSSVSAITSSTTLTNKRMIALVASVTRGDYHFYMQHTDGTWSHKRGEGAPTNKCIDCQQLLTNDTINQHACKDKYYEEGANIVWYFLITKDTENVAHVDGDSSTFTALVQ